MTTEMKTIEYRGRQYRVPVWVKFVATDEDGAVYGYSEKPTKRSCFWMSAEALSCCIVSSQKSYWDNSLIEVA